MRDKANRIEYEWSRRACRYIRHPADLKAVRAELDAHLQDRISELTDSGLRYHDALRQVEAAMGDPDEVGRQLGSIHTPWMSYLVTLSKWLCVLLILFSLIFYGHQVWWDLESRFIYGTKPWTHEETYDYYCQDYEGNVRTACGVKSVKAAKVGDYTFRLVKGSYLDYGTAILWVEADHPFYMTDPEGFFREIEFYDENGDLLRGNRSIDGDVAIFEVFSNSETAEIEPMTLVADYGSKGFTWEILPDMGVTP